jgi:ADP-ribose pyrophosphatase
VSRSLVFQSERLTVFRDRAKMPGGGGRATEKIWIRRPRVSAMVVQRGPDRFVLVRQYRYGLNRTLWELPAGTVDAGESPRTCAIRECQEETGWIPREVRSLGWYAGAPAGSDETTHLYRMSGLVKGTIHLDEDEHLRVGEFSKARILRMLRSGQICDAKSIIGLYRYFDGVR